MTSYLPTSELDAVNALMEIIGEAPVTTLDDLALDAGAAQATIARRSREIQSSGWHWNTTYRRLNRDSDHEFPLPANVLSVDTIGRSSGIDAVQRGLRLFDRRPYNNSYKFNDVTSLEVKVVEYLPYSDLPSTAKNYVYLEAAISFMRSQLGPNNIDRSLIEERDNAKAMLNADEINNSDPNMLDQQADILARFPLERSLHSF